MLHWGSVLGNFKACFLLIALFFIACSEPQQNTQLNKETDDPSWVIPYGKEFWRNPAPDIDRSIAVQKNSAVVSPEINIGDVIDRVSHAIKYDPEPTTKAETYQAIFDSSGMKFSPFRPGKHSSSQGIRFRTTKISRGGTVLYQDNKTTRSWLIYGNTAQVLLGSIVEHHEVRQSGVKITWILREPLIGSGSVTIESRLSGMEYAGKTEDGIHFADAQGVARIRVGPVDVVDAENRRWKASISVFGDVLVIEVPAEILSVASYPLAVDPYISPEFGMDVAVPSVGNYYQHYPTVAHSSSCYLLVWYEELSDHVIVRGTRVDDSGNILDPIGIHISLGPHYMDMPYVASNGSDFFVAWRDYRNRSSNSYDIYGTRILSQDGSVLDQTGIPISTAPEAEEYPAVASDGTDYFVVFQRERDIRGVRVLSSDGHVLDSEAIDVSSSQSDQHFPSVAFGGDYYLVTWEDDRNSMTNSSDIFGSRLRASDGAVIDTNDIAIAERQSMQLAPSVSYSNNSFLVVWGDASTQGAVDVVGTRVRASDGVVLDPGFIDICIDCLAGISTAGIARPAISLASNGNIYLVVWYALFSGHVSRISGKRVRGSDGYVMDQDRIVIDDAPGLRDSPAVASDGNKFLVVWRDYSDDRTLSKSIFGTTVEADGTVTGATANWLSRAANDQYYPVVATNGSSYFVVWSDGRNHLPNYYDIVGVRVDAESGSILDASGIVFTTAPEFDNYPAVASNGSDYLVVWSSWPRWEPDDSVILGMRVNGSSGSLMDSDPIAICTQSVPQSKPCVAFDGTNYLVAWSTPYDRWGHGDIFAARIGGDDGSLLDPDGISVCEDGSDQDNPSLAFGGGNYLVVWSDTRNILTTKTDIYGARIRSSDGTVLDPGGNAISSGVDYEGPPSVSFGETNFLVVWKQWGGVDSSILASRVSGDQGAVLDPWGIWIGEASGYGRPAQAADLNGNFLVAWVSERYQDLGKGIYGIQLRGSDGTLIDMPGFSISDSITHEETPSMAFNGEKFLVAYRSLQEGSFRVGARIVAFDFCNIGLDTIPAGNVNPLNTCQVCMPSVTTTDWTDDDGRPCDDELFCTVNEACLSGSCVGGSDRDCSIALTEPQCQTAVCDEENDICLAEPATDGVDCEDGSYCTLDDTCRSGSCIGESQRDCSASVTEPQCQVAVCDEVIDTCIAEPANEGEACDDGLYCTVFTACEVGVCTCNEFLDCSWVVEDPQCQAPRCDEGSGSCVADPQNEGLGCDDGNYCTIGDTCLLGSCTGSIRNCSEVVSDRHCQIPRCDEELDMCVADTVNEGLGCDDGEYCTVGEKCQSGSCTGGMARDCSWVVHWKDCQVGYCSESEDACVASTANEGGSCSDGDFCTVGDTCRNGVCVGGEPLDCYAAVTEPQCQVGRCDSWRGTCVAESVREGENCEARDLCMGEAVCRNGKCVGKDVCTIGGGGCACGSTSSKESSIFFVICLLGLLTLIRRRLNIILLEG